ncbi:MAG: UPF0280 family protein [Planctomycetota bacterium]
MPYERRTYRGRASPDGLVTFRVKVGETDLQIAAERDLSERARVLATEARRELASYREGDPEFFSTLEPHDVREDAPGIARDMARAGRLAGTGPMAAVAGAIAERVGRGLLKESREVVVENGGDVFMVSYRTRRVAVFAGASPLSMKVALEVQPEETPLGLATSSGTVGPSTSFGRADAAMVIAPEAALADAVATALGNRVREPEDMEGALEWALSVEGVRGALVIVGSHLGAKGKVRLAEGTP